MAVAISGEYLGDKKIKAVHGPSGTEIMTAAPVDNNGDGSSFSPTDLTATSLASCMLTIMAIVAERNSIDLRGTRFSVSKHMNESPRFIKALPVTFHLPASIPEAERPKLEKAALTCPVHASLREEVTIEIDFRYE